MVNKKPMFLALYDFASKQEYIYRTSKIKEISGASILLSEMYEEFINILKENKINILYKEDGSYCPFDCDSFPADGADGQVLYDGGGNLMVFYKDEETYKKANNIISVMLLKEYPGLHLIAAGVKVEDKSNFSDGDDSDVLRLYRENTRRKNLYPATDLTAVTPMTQIDPMTFLPVYAKFNKDDPKSPYPASEVSLSKDRLVKAKKYNDKKEDFDKIEDGLVAIIYIDGNSMGKKLTSLAGKDYNVGVEKQRAFSDAVRKAYVDDPIENIKKLKVPYRKIIGSGDEITLMCRAEDALAVIKAYFESLEGSKSALYGLCSESFYEFIGIKTKEDKELFLKNTSCAGIALIHAKSPFTVAYELAEAACENAKKKAHKTPGNYIDFYFCHAGAVADFDALREREQGMTARPYAYYGTCADDATPMTEFDRLSPVLNLAGRSNVKALGNAAQKGETDFAFEVERVNSYLAAQLSKKANADKNPKDYIIKNEDLKVIYDMSEFFDVWFNEKKKGEMKNAAENNA